MDRMRALFLVAAISPLFFNPDRGRGIKGLSGGRVQPVLFSLSLLTRYNSLEAMKLCIIFAFLAVAAAAANERPVGVHKSTNRWPLTPFIRPGKSPASTPLEEGNLR